MRLDVEVVQRGLAESRQKAQELIRSGVVYVNSVVVNKSSLFVSEDDKIQILGEVQRYVGRGGLKLECALNNFPIDVSNKVCLDIGASTGGFTDCLLQNGAKKVFAVDVGHGQLHSSLQNREDVVSLEGINIKDLSLDMLDNIPDFICCDVSFISVSVVIEKISTIFENSFECVLLIKPQFEAGKQNIGKNGVVKDKKVHLNVISKILECCQRNGITPLGVCKSSITGGEGNVEYLLYGKKGFADALPIDIKTIVG